MKNANLKMPNLYSYTNAKKMKAGTYKYFGVQAGDIKSKVNKMWGPARRFTKLKYDSKKDRFNRMAFYGSEGQVSLYLMESELYEYRDIFDFYEIESMSFKSEKKEYEYSNVVKYFGKPDDVSKSDDFMLTIYDPNLMIDYEKYKGKWYAFDVTIFDPFNIY